MVGRLSIVLVALASLLALAFVPGAYSQWDKPIFYPSCAWDTSNSHCKHTSAGLLEAGVKVSRAHYMARWVSVSDLGLAYAHCCPAAQQCVLEKRGQLLQLLEQEFHTQISLTRFPQGTRLSDRFKGLLQHFQQGEQRKAGNTAAAACLYDDRLAASSHVLTMPSADCSPSPLL